jgi:hypothetical protein
LNTSKNIQTKNKQISYHPKIPAPRKKQLSESTYVKHAPSPETPLVMDNLHELRSTPSETREKSYSPHVHKTEDLNR